MGATDKLINDYFDLKESASAFVQQIEEFKETAGEPMKTILSAIIKSNGFQELKTKSK